MSNDALKNMGLLLAILSPLLAAGVVLERVDRAKDDIIRNQDSDAKQWIEITKLRVEVGRLDERGKCR